MAFDMLLKIEGIAGESKITGFVDQIDVLAWSWGESNSGSFHTGGGGGAGKVNVQDLSFTKWVDIASPLLLLYCASGQHIPSAILTIRKSGGKVGKDAIPYLIITMKELLVTSVSTGGSGGEDRLTENVTFNFAKVEFKYTPQDATGAAGTAKTFKWNIEANEGDVS
ncbi:Hcp family type VI secretion system effector [Chromatium okenii]|jgi:type VI secretion system secreted protein Hcp|uniref:Type VI secretion system tube protein Hcp n=1 Tax=Chromatium okenii TaxID=61644 RepID=A0A2S7XP42_9GAMM|nr:type VI secretion system tube protein Hcp [Chromatium okenii]MBV5311253.1 type VI secretion system tube protein Hcp [Chromatium okenii]PQJ95151.1 type VI secretion system tube protein Hcp [Chromatium okenii]